MKFFLNIFLLLIFAAGKAQDLSYKVKLQEFKNCTKAECKVTKSFLLAEHFLETDDIQSSQKWLDVTKDLISPAQSDTTTVFIHSLQSELFYYDGLFQFGINEAEKAIQKAKQLSENLLIANGYFFKGINQMEMNQFNEAEKSLWKARDFQPDNIARSSIRSTIQEEHIFNNIAQLKLKIYQSDSAVWYNSKAYQFAKKVNSKRGIPNVEQTFGQIYLEEKKMDSAVFYFQKSILSAQKSEYFDIVLLNYGFMMQCYEENQIENNRWFEKGLELINQKIINSTFQHYFYKVALNVFKKTNQIGKLSFVQEKLISINEETRLKGNLNIQNITEQYSKNENKLLLLQVEELKKQRKFTILQLIAALLSVIILSLVIIIIRRKNKIQKTLLQQKNEISKDLHDDIGSGLSSILIHADLLLKNDETSDKQKILASKINLTGKEISQRLNTFIWSLNAEHNTLQHFSEYVKLYGATLFEETPIAFSFSTTVEDSELIKMHGHLRKNLFYAIKEVLNNSLKHAQATKIDVKMKLISSKQFQIAIQDNGTGISKENAFGNGLKNIQNRVEQMNGTFSMKTEKGLLTLLIIPL
ncbi:tetratricopeptide repeat-containing sensor histidine kinase [Flavobacterium lacus]|uniref:histidine kinase n=1 Tax=Flavobacterium lacus TaxID=1353778 RepID=A0A328WW53_9FLAO|nr:ATP-binding protein [Flavobacterium lacus]RAR50442.1 histidine kinase/DNA gyrase B/HSP90-like ATPase [Flavobacterium lacus]